jgi:hypothetical protein
MRRGEEGAVINLLLGVLAIGIGVAVIVARQRFVDAGEASRAAFWRKSQDSGSVRFRKTYNRTIVVVTGGFFMVMGFLNLVGVIHWVNG